LKDVGKNFIFVGNIKSVPNLYIIAGPNGAGKTTASYTILPEMLDCKEFVNADEIAKGLSPFQPEKAAIEAGRIMLKKISELIHQQQDFAFETTLSTKTYIKTIEQAREKGFEVTLLFFWLNTVELAKERVKARVKEGGHDIPKEVIERRYENGIKNLINLYIKTADNWILINNSENPMQIIAEGGRDTTIEISNKAIWNQITQTTNGK